MMSIHWLSQWLPGSTQPFLSSTHTFFLQYTSRQACQCLGLHVSVCVQNESSLLVAANCFANVLYVFCSQLLLWNHTQRHVCMCVCVCPCVCRVVFSFADRCTNYLSISPLSLPQSSSLAFSWCRFLPDALYSHLLIIPARLWLCVCLHVHMRDILSPAEATLLGPAVTIYLPPHPHVHTRIYQIHLFFWCHRRIDARC